MKHLKQEFDKLTFKETLVYLLAFISLVMGFVLLFVGMFTAPVGEIHDSVLTAYGLTLIFVGSLLGISMHYNIQLAKFKKIIAEFLTQAVAQAGEPGEDSTEIEKMIAKLTK